MSITSQRKQINSITVSSPRARKYMGYNPKREFKKGWDLTQDELSNGISTIMLITRSSRIYSHK